MSAGVVIGLVSRAVDTAAWAPPWIGLVLSPWLVFAFLVGAWSRGGAPFGLLAIGAVVAAYLASAGTDAAELWPRLLVLVAVAGPAFGAAGAAWRRRGRFGGAGLGLLGAAVVIEALALWTQAASVPERAGIGLEGLLGFGLLLRAGWLAARHRAPK